MSEWLLRFLFRPDAGLELLLLFLGSLILGASIFLHWQTQKRYAFTWTSTETTSSGVAAGPYRDGQSTVTSLVPRAAPMLAQVATFSGHALSLYLTIFLPFFLPLCFRFPYAASLTVVVIAAGIATRRSALRILDGSAPPEETPAAPAVLFMTGVVAFFPWPSFGTVTPSQVALFNVVLPLWAAVQAALILASARLPRRVAQGRDGVGRQ
jgi:hypothetical protein